MRVVTVALVLGLILACLSRCTPDMERESLEIEEIDQVERKQVSAKEYQFVTPYEFDGKKHSVEGLGCLRDASRPVVVLVNADANPFAKGACDSWLAQTFLSADFNTVAVNRPGFGKSSPQSDFSGPRSVSAIKTFLSEFAKTKSWIRQPRGVWGEGSGAIAAAFFAKEQKNVQWLILGNGIYDLEDFSATTQDAAYRQMLAQGKGSRDEADFQEERSIAWDTSGLPGKIMLYHSKLNDVVSFEQANSMRDTLAAEQVEVSLMPIEKMNHRLNEAQHRLVLEAQIKKIVSPN